MAVRFVIGTAGSGKSRHCIEAIKSAISKGGDEKLVFLVPEQATYQMERQILADENIGGYSNAYIVSFNRLGFWLIDRNSALEPLTKTAKQLIISKIMRQNKSRLKVFAAMVNEPGMAAKMAAMISELYQYGKSGADLRDVIERTKTEAAAARQTLDKLADISLIYEEYIKFITGRFENPDAQLESVKKQIAQSDVFKGCRLWVDGFSGFTPVEYDVLTELLKVCGEAEIALSMPCETQDRCDLFLPVLETKGRLDEIIAKNNLPLAPSVFLNENHRFAVAADLRHLERNLFRECEEKIPAPNIKIVNPLNCESEVGYIVEQINSLVFESGFRYRDIAVILSDMDAYETYIRRMFGDFGIPYFIDKRRSSSQHPLIHLLLSAIRVAVRGFDRLDIFGYLKTSLVPIDSFEAAILENYCIARGIEKDDWLSGEKWSCRASEYGVDGDGLDAIRKKATAELLRLESRLRVNVIKAVDFAAVMFDFLNRLKIADVLKERQQQSADDSFAEAAEHTQIYNQTVEIISQIAHIFGDEEVETRILCASVCDALCAITSALIPPGQDQVMISQIERSRHPDLKAVFIAGAAAKNFPAPINDGSLLTDNDRRLAADGGCVLDEGRQAKLNNRFYLAYTAMTRSSQKLFISYPRTDSGGRKQQPSDIITNMLSLFDSLTVQHPGIFDSPDKIRRSWQLADYLCVHGGRNGYAAVSGVDAAALKNAVKNDQSLAGCAAVAETADKYTNHASLDAAQVFEGCLETSVSRLQCYAACPYRYFARHILELKRRKTSVYDALIKGDLSHRVIDMVTKQLIAEGAGFGDVSEQRLIDITIEKADAAAAGDKDIEAIVNLSRHNRFIFEAMKKELCSLMRSLRLMASVSRLKTAASEIDFGLSGQSRGMYIATPAGRKVLLRGKIDRLDTCGNIAVVYDYKSRNNPNIDWEKLYHGLDLQLPAYVLSVNNAEGGAMKGLKAAGAFFIPISPCENNSRLSDALGMLTARKARGFYDGQYFAVLDNSIDAGEKSDFYALGLKTDGDFNKNESGDMLTERQMNDIMQFTLGKIGDICDGILSGDISVRPYRLKGQAACSNCDYKQLCRFDRQINQYNNLAPLSGGKKQGFFDIITEGGEQ